MHPMTPLPRLYAILDSSCFPDTAALCRSARELASAGFYSPSVAVVDSLRFGQSNHGAYLSSSSATIANASSTTPSVRVVQ